MAEPRNTGESLKRDGCPPNRCHELCVGRECVVKEKFCDFVVDLCELCELFDQLCVKNLLTVLSSRIGGLGSTRPAATEDKVTDKRAEKARSD